MKTTKYIYCYAYPSGMEMRMGHDEYRSDIEPCDIKEWLAQQGHDDDQINTLLGGESVEILDGDEATAAILIEII